MPQPLQEALVGLRPLLLGSGLVRAVAAGRRRAAEPAYQRAEVRPVDLKAGRRLQVVTTVGDRPITANLAGPEAESAVDALLAEPFGNWRVETLDEVVQLRVTKRGEAQVHRSPTSRREIEPAAPHDRAPARLLDPGDPLFDALGASADKRRQVDAFLRLLAPSVERAVASARAADRPLHVVDLGCGNAYLTFAAHRWLSTSAPEVRTVGVERRPEPGERNARIAAGLGLSGLSFVTGTIAAADPGRLGLAGGVDLVLALHACDTATDEALAAAVRWAGPVVLAAPCCHHDIQRQLSAAWRAGDGPPEPFGALARDGILRERFADVLTDTLRAALLRLLGYRVDVVEFVDSRHTPRNMMIRAIRTDARPDARRRAEYRDLAAAWRVRPALADLLAAEVGAALGEPAARG